MAKAAAPEAPSTRQARRAVSLPPDERRSMIVAATLPLLLEHGEMVTTRQIADAAGIAEGTIFRVFADKDAVIAAVVDTALDTGPLEAALGEIDLALPLAERVEAAVAILQQRVVDIWRLLSSISPRFHDVAARPVIDSSALTVLFRPDAASLTVEPDVASRLLRALTLATTHPMLAGDGMSADEVVALFLHGVCGSGPC